MFLPKAMPIQGQKRSYGNWMTVSVALFISLSLYLIWKGTRPTSRSRNLNNANRSGCGKFPSDCETTAPFIFDSLYSLLKQWPSSYGANGHSIVPVRLPRATPLYHAKQYIGLPRKPTWFSFDPEMGLGIYASTGITFMHTFVTTRELKLLYFDGQSAVLSSYGTLDSQTALLRQHVSKEPGKEFVYNETARGHELCALAHDMRVDGIMRMDAGFEALICNFESSHLVESHAVNVTVPGRGLSREDKSNLPQDPTRSPPHGIGNIYASNNGWEWIRSGTWHYGGYGEIVGNHPESRVDLDLCGFVTFYDPNLRSLSGKHHESIDQGQSFQSGWGLRRGHRLFDISVEDSALVKTWVRTASDIATPLRVWAYSPARSSGDNIPCSGINWQALTETIVSQHRGRITEIAAATARYQEGAMSLEDFFAHVHGLSHAALQPFVQYPTDDLTTIEEIKLKTLRRCELLYTKHIPSKAYNRFEALIKDSVEIVLRRICSWQWDTFVWTERHTSNLFQNGRESHERTTNLINGKRTVEEVEAFAETTKEFLKWINWDLWTRCEDKCSWNELCYIPMWPLVYAPGKHQGGPYGGSNLTLAEQLEFWRPKCLSRRAFDRGGGRGRDPDNQLPDVPEYRDLETKPHF